MLVNLWGADPARIAIRRASRIVASRLGPGGFGLVRTSGILPRSRRGLAVVCRRGYMRQVAPFENPGEDAIRGLLERVRRIAVVGLSPKPYRDSHRVARYLLERGYEILPVYPREEEILGQRVYRRVQDIEAPVDLVDVFRRSEGLPAVIDDVLAARAGRAVAAARLHRRAGRPARPGRGRDGRDGPLCDGRPRATPRAAVAARLALSRGDCQRRRTTATRQLVSFQVTLRGIRAQGAPQVLKPQVERGQVVVGHQPSACTLRACSRVETLREGGIPCLRL